MRQIIRQFEIHRVYARGLLGVRIEQTDNSVIDFSDLDFEVKINGRLIRGIGDSPRYNYSALVHSRENLEKLLEFLLHLPNDTALTPTKPIGPQLKVVAIGGGRDTWSILLAGTTPPGFNLGAFGDLKQSEDAGHWILSGNGSPSHRDFVVSVIEYINKQRDTIVWSYSHTDRTIDFNSPLDLPDWMAALEVDSVRVEKNVIFGYCRRLQVPRHVNFGYVLSELRGDNNG